MTIAEGRGDFFPGASLAEAGALLFELTSQPVLLADERGVLLRVNAAAAALLGLPAEALCGLPLADFVPEEHRSDLERQLEQLAAGTEVRCRIALGGPGARGRRPLEWRAAPMGKGFVAVARELGRSGPVPRESPVDHVPDALLALDRDRRVAWVSWRGERLLGGVTAQLKGRPLESLFRDLTPLEEAPAGAPVELRALRQDGGEVPVRVTLTGASGREFQFLVTLTELTPARCLDEWRRWQPPADDLFAVWDLVGERLHASDAVWRLLGLEPRERLDPDELIGLLHPEDAERVESQVRALLADPGGRGGLLECRLRQDGGERLLQARLTVQRDLKGRSLRVLASVQQGQPPRRCYMPGMDDQGVAEALFGTQAGLMLVVDREGRVVRFNPAAERVTGFTAEEVVGRSFWDLFFPTQEAPDMAALFRTVGSGSGDEMFTTEWLTRDGRRVPITWSHAVVRDEAGALAYTVCLGFEVGELRQVRRRLLEMEENYRRLVELSFDLVVVESEGVIVELNPRGAAMLGAAPADYVGRPLAVLIAPECPYAHGIVGALEGANPKPTPLVECRLNTRDGRTIDVEGLAIPIRWQGRPGTQAVFRDITLRKEAERSLKQREAFFHTLARAAPVGIFQADRDGRLTYVNERFLHITGSNRRRTLGDGWRSQIHPDDRDTAVGQLEGAISGGRRFDAELRLRRPDGATVWIRAIAAPEQEGERAGGYIGSIHDITTAKHNEQELRRYREQLEERVARRTSELQAVNRELEAFTYSVTHDLRAPLRAINGFGQALEEEYGPRLDEQAGYYLGRIRSNSKFMGDLIEDLLELSRVNQYELAGEPVDLAELARAVVTDLRVADPQRRVVFTCADALPVQGDPRLLRILLRNLVENAWKYTGNEPLARVRVGVAREDEESIYFVEDNGIGFDMNRAEGLFRAFHRLDTAKKFEGTGIGLATVQRIVNRHGGRVWAVGEEGRGATFFFTLGSCRMTTGDGG